MAPAGVANFGGLSYWLWDAPCKHWDAGDTVALRLVQAGTGAGDELAGAYRDAALAGLTLTGAQLGAVFDSGTDSYTAAADANIDQVTIEAAAASSVACGVQIAPQDTDPDTPGHQVGIGTDGATVTVTVTAADGSTGSYTVVVGRGAAPAAAKSLTLAGIDDIGFEPLKERYQAPVPEGTTSTTVETVVVGDSALDAFAVTAGDTQTTPIAADGQVTLTAAKTPSSPCAPPLRRTSSNASTPSASKPPARPQRRPSRRRVPIEGDHQTQPPQPGVELDPAADQNHRQRQHPRPAAPVTPTAQRRHPRTRVRPGTFDYTASVAHDTAQITVTPTAPPGSPRW